MIQFVRVPVVCLCAMQSVALLVDVTAAQAPGPTKEHEVLKSEVGTWDAKMKLYHTPDAEPTVQDATETVELLPGGMWILAKYESKIMDMPFEGRSVNGYDPVKKKYVGTWVDNMNPHLMLIEGDYDPETKTKTCFSETRDPVSGKMIKYKQIARTIDENSRTFEMYQPDDKGEYVKMMEVEYKRRSR